METILKALKEIEENHCPENTNDILVRLIPKIIGYNESDINKFCYDLFAACGTYNLSEETFNM